MYGRLSDIAHAGLLQHQSLVKLDENDALHIVTSRPRLSESAVILLSLADAWVVVCELTQRDQLLEFRALRSFDEVVPDPDREFLHRSSMLVSAVLEAEGDRSSG